MPVDPELIERQAESEVVKAMLADARRGQGGVFVVEGPSGSGKSALLRHLRGLAAPPAWLVLHAVAREFERDFAFGVTRQLAERWFVTANETERRVALSGAATLAEPVFSYQVDDPAAAVAESSLHGTLHGLYWLCANLSARRPLVLIVDDLQWADSSSLQFLSYLAGRLEDLPLLVAVAYNTDEKGPAEDIVATLSSSPLARVSRPAPLSELAALQLAAELWGTEPAPVFARACHEQTGGNPYLLRELLAEAHRAGVPPTAAGVRQMRSLVPPKIAQSVLHRLRRLPEPARALAQAVAVLDPPAELRVAGAVAGLDEAGIKAAAGLLMDAGLLCGGLRPALAGPLIRTAVYADLAPQARQLAHARAAAALHAAEAAPEQVAAQLLRTAPDGNPATVEVLRQAASQALSRQLPQPAVTYLRRAVEECPDGARRSGLLAELGSAELRAHNPAAVRHLSQALDLTADPHRRAAIGLELAVAVTAAGTVDLAVDVLRQLATELAAADPDLALRLESQRFLLARLGRPGLAGNGYRLAQLVRDAGDGSGRASARSCEVLNRLPACRTGSDVAALAAEVVADDRLVGEDDSEVPPASLAGWMLGACDRLADADRLLARAAGRADARGLLLARADVSATRALLVAESGRLMEAEAEVAGVLRGPVGPGLWGPGRPVAFGTLLHVLVERDEAEQAWRELDAAGLTGELPELTPFGVVLLARARLRIARRELEDGLADVMEYRRRHCHEVAQVPAFPSSVRHAVAALTRLERQEEARALAAEEVRRAREFGAARPLATALRAAGLAVGGARGLALLEEAVRVLAKSDSLLERTYALVDYGGALRREGHRTDARHALRSGIALAEWCGAVALRKHAYSELVIAGGRVRRRGRGDVRSLTPSERRVADMAATGMRNREIARELFVTVKTIEWHLSQVYPKLGISTRAELRRALAGELSGG